MLKKLDRLDIVLSIFNQEKIIERVLYGIFINTTTSFNMVIVFDGCSDRTEERVRRYIGRYRPKLLKNITIEYAPNVYETRANNIGFKLVSSDFFITLQDDMVINEFAWEKRLTFPLRKFNDVIAVSARTAQNLGTMTDFDNNKIFVNQIAKELKNLNRETFAIRDGINRGPIAFNTEHLKSVNYLNEKYAPSDMDDADLCMRAWTQKKLRSGAFWINYISDIRWGKARAKDSTMNVGKSISKNALNLRNDHKEYINIGIKHDENIIIKESEIDYDKNIKKNLLKSIFIYPVRIKSYYIKDFIFTYPKICIIKLFKILGIDKAEENGVKKSIKMIFGIE